MSALSFLLCCFLGFPAIAEALPEENSSQQMHEAVEELFEIIDLDNNGSLSVHEMYKMMPELMKDNSLHDRNKADVTKKITVDFRKADVNQDNKLEIDEAGEILQKMLNTAMDLRIESIADPQSNETISEADKYSDFKNSLDENHQRNTDNDDQSVNIARMRLKANKFQANDAFEKADLNKDDYLSFDEFKKYTISSMSEIMDGNVDNLILEDDFLTEKFEEINSNSDRKLSKQEFIEDYISYVEAN